MASLLNNASLLLNPAGSIIAYEEDKILSVLPRNGTGDFTFSGGDGGTRVNQDGYIEQTPANINTYSEKFGSGYWNNFGGTITDDSVIAPNGTVTGTTFNGSPAGTYKTYPGITVGQVYTVSMYVKLGTATNCVIIINNTQAWNTVGGKSFTSADGLNTTDWTRISFTFTGPAFGAINWHIGYQFESGVTQQTNGTYFVWGAQLNIGSTAKPYQPTTDRLNYPRITYQNGRGALLSEPQRTNLVLYSQQFNVGGWTLYQGASLTPSASLSPDGTQNAFALNVATLGYSGIYQSTGGGTIVATTSVFAKKGTLDWILMVDSAGSAGRAWFNLANGTIGTVTGGWVAKIEPFEDGWYRCILQNPSATIFGFQIGASTGDNVVTPATTGNIYIYGAQLEAGTYPTSYIPTTSATVTRPIDNANKTGISSLIGQTEGVIYFKGTVNNSVNPFTNIINSERNTNASFFFSRINTNGQIDAGLFSNGSAVGRITAGNVPNGQLSKIAYAYKSGDSALFINGVQAGSTNTGTFTLPSTLDDIFLDDPNIFFAYPESVSFNTAALFNSRLTNTQLQELTTVRSGSGGNISYYGPYTIHTFTGSATFTPSFNGQVEVLVVAGGGGGGVCYGGGGGAGGVLYTSAYGVSTGTGITVTVGAGGTNQVNVVGNGGPGGNSVFGGLTAIGGGYGGGVCGNIGGNGGSGGGGSGTGGSSTTGGLGIAGQGNNGNSSIVDGGGGGGGAGNGGLSVNRQGGNGLPYSITGFSNYYGGGGSGGGATLLDGGLGGGGKGGIALAAGVADATPYTGGGGGGSIISGTGISGLGGAGIVIVRYLT
jgi:hypothetical protein